MHCKEIHCPLPLPQAVWQCIAGVPLCRQRPPPGQDSPSPQLVGPRIARLPLPIAPRRCCGALQELHCPLRPLPTGSLAVHSRSSTAHCPQAVRQCIAGVALPTASRQCGSVLQEFHCPVPTAHKCSAAGHTQCSAVHSTMQCGTAHKVLMVQRGIHGAVGLQDPV